MNWLYVITVGSMEVMGLTSPREILDVVCTFNRLCLQRGASVDFQTDGVFVAVKDGIQLTLKIGGEHEPMPSERLEKFLIGLIQAYF